MAVSVQTERPFIIPEPGSAPDETSMPNETTAAVRQAQSLERLKRHGGRRIPVNLPVDSMLDLRRIRARDGVRTNTAAVIAALHHYARKP